MDSCNCSTVKLELGFPRNFLHVMIRNLSSIWLWCFFVAIPTVFARSCAIVTRSNIHMGNSLILGRSEKVLLSWADRAYSFVLFLIYLNCLQCQTEFLIFFQINTKYVGSRAPPINFECVEFQFFAAWSFVFKHMNVSVVILCCPTKTSLRHVLASFRTVELKVWCSLSIDFAQGICWILLYKTWCLMLSLHLLVSDRVAVSFTAFVKMSESFCAHNEVIFFSNLLESLFLAHNWCASLPA